VGTASAAEDGFYVGAGVGQSTIKASTDPLPVGGGAFNTFHFDKSDTGYKGYVGYNFLPWLGVEGGYVEFGNPSDSKVIGATTLNGKAEASGWQAFVVGTLPVGPVDLFVKAGGIETNADIKVHDNFSGLTAKANESNQLFAYGIGAAYNFGHFSFRIENEGYKVDKLDDLYLVSAGLTYHFGD
jgi:OOP family OmpA-OmpF porin